ncbi:ankyrin repeat-containing protein NPR4-like isoform X2 [Vitis riparia]|uniref:ankyrin repeat-containing protein NPR4-like isoform X2 n=1 Tax=Vitis riparia TaxID=96939 RepID=UPI00155B2C7F|nr:ankyrin repeat-containing protein NPR4-like isoform X2 [Vitis riparia]
MRRNIDKGLLVVVAATTTAHFIKLWQWNGRQIGFCWIHYLLQMAKNVDFVTPSQGTMCSMVKTMPSFRSCFPEAKSTDCSPLPHISHAAQPLPSLPEAASSNRHFTFQPDVVIDIPTAYGYYISNVPNERPGVSNQGRDEYGSSPLAAAAHSGEVSSGFRTNARLHLAALSGDWDVAERIFESDHQAVRARITRAQETPLHIAAGARHLTFVENLVRMMTPADLALQNKVGNTALCFAAVSGVTKIAEVMVNKNKRLPLIRGSEGATPLHMATLLGHREMVWYLYNKTDSNHLTDEDHHGLLIAAITSDLFDVALKIVQKHPKIATARGRNGETALHILARKPSAYQSGSQLGFLQRCIYACLHVELSGNSSVIHKELGIVEFLIELIHAYPDLIWKVDTQSRSIFHIAVLHRQEKVFNLIHEIGALKDLIASYRDENNNNMLHLAGKLAPSDRLKTDSGAALQLRRELHWFKEVEKIVQPLYREIRNSEGKTPQTLFMEEHKVLVREGEKWMKDTAASCMLVATLIATVMFAAFFTVPGGDNDNTGIPIFLKRRSFTVFAVSDALSFVSSAASILMFLSILTSRYAEEDFLHSLPNRLTIGLGTLFISVATMMIAFCATLFLVLGHGLHQAKIPIALVACIPVSLFALLQFPLFADMVSRTYGSRMFFRPSRHLLH